jgi:NADPH-dependent F420 reductase
MSDITQPTIHTIGILGGTGKEGKGLAYRWAKAGYRILIGSRQSARAQTTATELLDLLHGQGEVVGLCNPEAAQQADLVVMTVPYTAHKETLLSLKGVLTGKILVDVTVPLVPPRVTRVQMPEAGSAAQEAQEILGVDTQVVSAFQNISYEHLLHDEPVDCDVLVCGGNKVARQEVIKLVAAAGLIGWDAGPIENSVVAEGLTSILIGINKQYGVQSAGIRISGVDREQ